MFIFDGGVLSDAQIELIQLQADELLSFRFFSRDALPQNLSPTLKERVLVCWQNREQEGRLDTYLEEGALRDH